MPAALILILVLLLVASAFEAAETALLAMGNVRLQTLIKNGDKRAETVAWLRGNVRKLLGTLLLGQTVCDIASAAIATATATEAFGDAGVGIVTGVMTVIVLIFVNLIPKSYAANNAERLALAFARPVYVLTVALSPIVRVVDRFVGLFVPSKRPEVRVTEEEIKTMTRMGVSAGAVESGEKELIERVFLFNDITASDVLTPKELMFCLDADKPIGEALAMANAQKYSRYPVYEGTPDSIVGIVHIKDLLTRLSEPGALERQKIREFMSAPVFVPESSLTDDLFRDLKRNHVHMAIVINEQRAVVGLLTLEDLLEELVGEIADESDVDEHVIKRIDKHSVLVHGDTDIPDVNRFFNTKIDAGDARTVGRLVRKKAGRAPKQGQPVMIAEGLMAVVEQVNRGRILKVRLIKSIDGSLAKSA